MRILAMSIGICYNASRQNEVSVQSDKAKTPEVAPSGVFFRLVVFSVSI